MSGDWLFDGEGPPDPEAERLQALLRPYRYVPPRRRTWLPWAGLVLAAAALLLAVVGGWWGPAPWSARTASCDGCRWEVGAALDTDTAASARLEDRGELRALAGTRVTRLPSDDARLRLERGEVDVFLVAPRGWLVVEVPGVEVVDLGCAYALRVDASGHGVVQVRSGAVELRGTTRTEVRAGAMAATWPDGHTGLPVRIDADRALIDAVDAWDREATRDPASLLAAAGERDGVTLWHVLARDPGARAAVLDRLAELAPGELPVERERVLRGEPEALDALLGFLVGATPPQGVP